MFSLLVGGGLMALVFYSNRHGYDDLSGGDGERALNRPFSEWLPGAHARIAPAAQRRYRYAPHRPSGAAMNKTLVQEQFGKTAASYLTSDAARQGRQPASGWSSSPRRRKTGACSTSRPAAATSPTPSRRMSRASGRPTSPRKCSTWCKAEADKRGLANVRTTYAKAEALPFEDASFDLVTCRIAPHHFDSIPNSSPRCTACSSRAALVAMVDNVVPAGSVGDYVNAFERFRDPSHLRAWTMEEWRDALGKAGFAITHEEQIYKQMEFKSWAARHDANMQALLRAMLAQVTPEVKAVLEPQERRRRSDLPPVRRPVHRQEARKRDKEPPAPNCIGAGVFACRNSVRELRLRFRVMLFPVMTHRLSSGAHIQPSL